MFLQFSWSILRACNNWVLIPRSRPVPHPRPTALLRLIPERTEGARFSNPDRKPMHAWLLLIPLTLGPAQPQAPSSWIKQLGTPGTDLARCSAPDGSGGLLVGGETAGALSGPSNGAADAWIARYTETGAPLWVRQIGTSADEEAWCIASDGAGGCFVGGETQGSLGAANLGKDDCWLGRFNASGAQLWMRQFGTSGGERVQDAVPDGNGGVFLSGTTEGALAAANVGSGDNWVAHVSASGQTLWIKQWGTDTLENALTLAPDSAGGLFVGGMTAGFLASPPANEFNTVGDFDCWVARMDGLGNLLWTRQLGTSEFDAVYSLASDGAGGVFACINTGGPLAGPSLGSHDACLARFDASGAQLWIQQFGTAQFDSAFGAASDGVGGCTVAGSTLGSFAAPNAGGIDACSVRFDAGGNELARSQVGTSANDVAYSVTQAPNGGIYLVGQTDGALGGPSAGSSDAWIAGMFGSCAGAAAYCNSSATSIPGCQPGMSSQGSPSYSNPAAFVMTAAPAPGAKVGLCLFGDHGPASIPFGTLGGRICVAAPLHRTVPKKGSGTSGACNGSLSFSLLELVQASNLITPGVQVNAQVWCRDPANMDGFWLSNGLQFVVCP